MTYLPGSALPHHDAEAVHVSLLRVGLVCRHLGRHPLVGPQAACHGLTLVLDVLHQAGQPKIRDFDCVVMVHKHIPCTVQRASRGGVQLIYRKGAGSSYR
jgi:hypothetical protein